MIFNFWPFRLALGIFCIYIFVLISEELNLFDSPIWFLVPFGIPLIALYFINTYKYNENALNPLDRFTPNPIRIKKKESEKRFNDIIDFKKKLKKKSRNKKK